MRIAFGFFNPDHYHQLFLHQFFVILIVCLAHFFFFIVYCLMEKLKSNMRLIKKINWNSRLLQKWKSSQSRVDNSNDNSCNLSTMYELVKKVIFIAKYPQVHIQTSHAGLLVILITRINLSDQWKIDHTFSQLRLLLEPFIAENDVSASGQKCPQLDEWIYHTSFGFRFKKKTKQHLIRGELFMLGRKTARRCEFGDLRNNIGEIYDCSIDYNPVLA